MHWTEYGLVVLILLAVVWVIFALPVPGIIPLLGMSLSAAMIGIYLITHPQK